MLNGPVFRDTSTLREEVDVALAIVATPTPLHAATIRDLLNADRTPGIIWSEKPLAMSQEELDKCWGTAARSKVELRTLLHTSFAREVSWASAKVGTLVHCHGGIVSAVCDFFDPYAENAHAAPASLGSSWLDSGINALSVLARFVPLNDIIDVVHDPPLRSEVRLSIGDAGVANLTTAWTSGAQEETTIQRFEDGATLEMAHDRAAVRGMSPAAYVIEEMSFGRMRLAERYETMLESHLARDTRRLSLGIERGLHRLLASVSETPGRGLR